MKTSNSSIDVIFLEIKKRCGVLYTQRWIFRNDIRLLLLLWLLLRLLLSLMFKATHVKVCGWYYTNSKINARYINTMTRLHSSR